MEPTTITEQWQERRAFRICRENMTRAYGVNLDFCNDIEQIRETLFAYLDQHPELEPVVAARQREIRREARKASLKAVPVIARSWSRTRWLRFINLVLRIEYRLRCGEWLPGPRR
jgi:hypothetical protein